MSTTPGSLCVCGHPFAPHHQTPGAECFVYGCDCSTFKAKSSLVDVAYRDALLTCAARYVELAPPDLEPFVAEFTEKIAANYPLAKLNRWLGYIQGVLVERGITTVEAERNWTRPLFRPLDFAE